MKTMNNNNNKRQTPIHVPNEEINDLHLIFLLLVEEVRRYAVILPPVSEVAGEVEEG